MGLQGEAIITIIVILRVIAALPFNLFFEGFGLIALCVISLLIEFLIGVDELRQFKPRLGAECGILLGALTVPLLYLSQVVHSHQSSFYISDPKEFEMFRLEFWAAYACSCGLLLLLSSSLWSQQVLTDSMHANEINSRRRKIFFYSLIIVPFFLVIFSPRKVVVVLLHGAGCTSYFKYISKNFPGCASIGEFMLAAIGITICFGNVTTSTLQKISHFHQFFYESSLHFGIQQDGNSAILQATLVGLLLVPTFYRILCCIFSSLRGFASYKMERKADAWESCCNAVVFYISLALSLMVITKWLSFVHAFQQHPVYWIIQFIFETPQRLMLCAYWSIVLLGSVIPIWYAKMRNLELILVRKCFHIMAIILFIPGLLVDKALMKLAFSVAFCLFSVFEMIRVWRIFPLGKGINDFMKGFTDHRDSDDLIISHFSLLLGCALPLWLSCNIDNQSLTPFSGVVSLGVGDTMASVVGLKFGRMRLCASNKKTVEGTAACILSMLLACVLICYLQSSTLCNVQWVSLTIAVLCTGLMEAFTTQLDNAFIPLVFFSLLNL